MARRCPWIMPATTCRATVRHTLGVVLIIFASVPQPCAVQRWCCVHVHSDILSGAYLSAPPHNLCRRHSQSKLCLL